jgi:hypothetical protein
MKCENNFCLPEKSERGTILSKKTSQQTVAWEFIIGNQMDLSLCIKNLRNLPQAYNLIESAHRGKTE